MAGTLEAGLVQISLLVFNLLFPSLLLSRIGARVQMRVGALYYLGSVTKLGCWVVRHSND